MRVGMTNSHRAPLYLSRGTSAPPLTYPLPPRSWSVLRERHLMISFGATQILRRQHISGLLQPSHFVTHQLCSLEITALANSGGNRETRPTKWKSRKAFSSLRLATRIDPHPQERNGPNCRYLTFQRSI